MTDTLILSEVVVVSGAVMLDGGQCATLTEALTTGKGCLEIRRAKSGSSPQAGTWQKAIDVLLGDQAWDTVTRRGHRRPGNMSLAPCQWEINQSAHRPLN